MSVKNATKSTTAASRNATKVAAATKRTITTQTGATLPLGETTVVGDLLVTPTFIDGEGALVQVEGTKSALKESSVCRTFGGGIERAEPTLPNRFEGRGGFFAQYWISGVVLDVVAGGHESEA